MPTFALVANLHPESRSEVSLRLHTVPPFDLPLDGIDGHQVYLGPEHAAFVFWGADPEAALVRVSGREDVQQRVARAIEGLSLPRKLDERFAWERPGHVPRADGRAVAVLARGTELRDDASGAAVHALGERVGDALERERVFAGEGTALMVFERGADADQGDRFLSLPALAEAAPVVPLRPLEVLEQTYWFEAGDQLPPRPARGVLADYAT